MEDIVNDFADEATESLRAFSAALVRLEQSPASQDLVDEMFRAAHTIKGAAGFLALPGMERVSHSAENVLALVRSGEVEVTAQVGSALFAAVDLLAAYVGDLRSAGTESGRDDAAVLAELAHVAGLRSVPADPHADWGTGVAAPPDLAVSRSTGTVSVRVATAVLDALVGLVGELVTVRNALDRLAALGTDVELTCHARHLSAVTAAVRDGVLAARAQRVDSVWVGLERVVRDTALRAGVAARLVTVGGDIECDREVLDAVRDPLLHMVRNAVDHGIEDAQRRQANGKDPQGRLLLRASRVDDHLLVELCDDGRGIDPRRVAHRAVERGLVSAAQVAQMTEPDMIDLVLRAGLSTSDAVTTVSGRGVGMDVVARNVQQVGGTVELRSVQDQGTTVRLRLPMSVGVTKVLTVGVGTGRFAIAQADIVDLLRYGQGTAHNAVDSTCDGPVLRWRAAVLPLVDLPSLLDGRPGGGAAVGAVAVIRAGAGLLAVGVDRLLDSEEALVRPLGPHLQGSRLYGGAVVLADGSIALLLDGAGVAATAGRAAADLDRLPRDESVGQPASGAEELLVAEVGDGRRLAVPINLVVRLLVADAGDLDRVGSWEVLRLGERILPLVRVPASLAPDCDRTSGDPIHVVVVRTDAEGDVGIVVDSFYDVGSAQMFGALDEQGLTAVTQVHGRMAGQLDVRAAVAQACGSMAELAEFALVGAP